MDVSKPGDEVTYAILPVHSEGQEVGQVKYGTVLLAGYVHAVYGLPSLTNSWEDFHIFCQKYFLRGVSFTFENYNQNFNSKSRYKVPKFCTLQS